MGNSKLEYIQCTLGNSIENRNKGKIGGEVGGKVMEG